MLTAGSLLLVSVVYLAALFAVATWADRRAERGRSLLRNPYTYTLSLALYCSAWTFYGSVGLASREGLAFLPVYLGPTLAALLFPSVLRKILRVAKAQGITSIADFVAARYGKSVVMGGLVTLVAVLAAVPYIALQLKAVAASVAAILPDGGATLPDQGGADVALLVALVLAVFAIFFGARHIDATERHEGMVVAVALESVIKLAAFLAVGAFVTWGLFGGFGDLLARYAAAGRAPALTVGGAAGGLGYADWLLLTLLSGLAFLVLPRQFQVAVIENVDEDHVRAASWLLPLYLLAINVFVLPLAMAGTLLGAGDGDLYVLRVPLAAGHEWLALVAYVGGLSAAAAMVIVATVALSTMISNDLVMPALLRLELLGLRRRAGGDLSGLIVNVRRASILLMLALAYGFSRLVAGHYGLANIGFIAFAGVAQFAPPILLGLYWRGASLAGAIPGLLAGVAVWAYTLVLPALAEAGLADPAILGSGPAGIALLRPQALLGLEGLDPIAHAVLWSLAANATLLVLGSLLGRPGTLERLQAARFVDADREDLAGGAPRLWRGEAQVAALRGLLTRFLGKDRADVVFAMDARRRGHALPLAGPADAALIQLTERQLARGIGAASARIVVGSVVRGDEIGPGDLMEILDEASQVMEYSRRLEQKSAALERATAELRLAYDRLRQLDELKDEFVATVSHELRTPLTSIRSFSEILLDTPDLAEEERRHFLQIVVREADRLTRLVNDVLDIAKIESGLMEWRLADHDLRGVLEDAVGSVGGLAAERRVAVRTDLKAPAAPVHVDRDRLVQVAVNLLSNAAKFAPEGEGQVLVQLLRHDGTFLVRVEDNGPGVPEPYREAVFEKFRQVGDEVRGKPKGTGLGLTISRQIIERFGGRIWVEEASLGGAAVCFTLPAAIEEGRAAA
jgi:Na+/proline symporter/nitrogen-specific signal transduction histidine kinase